jgi:hypothetical protein
MSPSRTAAPPVVAAGPDPEVIVVTGNSNTVTDNAVRTPLDKTKAISVSGTGNTVDNTVTA